MSTFNTIHIFGFGDTQLIGKDTNGTVKGDTLIKQQALIDHIKTFKPADVVLTDHHVIHIFGTTDVRYLGKGTDVRKDKTSFSVKHSDLNAAILNDFITELAAAVAALPPDVPASQD